MIRNGRIATLSLVATEEHKN